MSAPRRHLTLARRWSVVATMALLVLGVAGCAISAESQATVVGPAPDVRTLTATGIDAAELVDPGVPDGTDPASLRVLDRVVQVVLVDVDGAPTVVPRRTLVASPGPLAAVEALLHGPFDPRDAETEEELGLRSAIAPATHLRAWEQLVPDVVRALLSSDVLDDPPPTAPTPLELRLRQVACTALLAGGLSEVHLAIGDDPGVVDALPVTVHHLGDCEIR